MVSLEVTHATVREEWIPRAGRPPLRDPLAIIVHAMGERIAGVPARHFLDKVGVDAHALITPAGEIVRLIDDDIVAYHAGASRLGTIASMNTRALGVELLIAGDHDYASFVRALRGREDPYTADQRGALVELCRAWCGKFPSIRLILGHEHVSGPWVRRDAKPDPGPWIEWPRLWLDVWGALPAPRMAP